MQAKNLLIFHAVCILTLLANDDCEHDYENENEPRTSARTGVWRFALVIEKELAPAYPGPVPGGQ